MRLRSLFVLMLVVTAGCAGPETASDWPAFRGPEGMGVSHEVGLPVSWSAEEGVLWRADAGWGNSTPVVAAGRVFLTSASGTGEGDVDKVAMAFDLATGERLWETLVHQARREKTHRLNSLAAPSASSDGERVYVYFGEVLAALDLDGTVLWKQTVDPDYREFSRYGAASSPVLSGKAVIVLQDREYASERTDDVGWIAAFDKVDGHEIWRTSWENTCCTYSTPVVVDRGAGEEILVALSGRIDSFSAETGEVLWSHGYKINQNVSGPVLEGDLLVVAGGAHNVRNSLGIRLSGAGAGTTTEELWSDIRLAPETSSPVLYDGMLFTVTTKGVIACRDAESGEVLWYERLNQGQNHAALVAADGKVYIGPGRGLVSVVAAAREYEHLAQNELEGDDRLAPASPAVADGSLLLRVGQYLYRIADTTSG